MKLLLKLALLILFLLSLIACNNSGQRESASKSKYVVDMGWYAMALVDILDYITDHPQKNEIINIIERTAEAFVKFQDKKTGVWWQVLDMADRKGNYLDGSVSSMFTYFLLKSISKGYLDKSYLGYAKKA